MSRAWSEDDAGHEDPHADDAGRGLGLELMACIFAAISCRSRRTIHRFCTNWTGCRRSGLDRHDDSEEVRPVHRHALGEPVDRVDHRQADLELVDDLGELDRAGPNSAPTIRRQSVSGSPDLRPRTMTSTAFGKSSDIAFTRLLRRDHRTSCGKPRPKLTVRPTSTSTPPPIRRATAAGQRQTERQRGYRRFDQ